MCDRNLYTIIINHMHIMVQDAQANVGGSACHFPVTPDVSQDSGPS